MDERRNGSAPLNFPCIGLKEKKAKKETHNRRKATYTNRNTFHRSAMKKENKNWETERKKGREESVRKLFHRNIRARTRVCIYIHRCKIKTEWFFFRCCFVFVLCWPWNTRISNRKENFLNGWETAMCSNSRWKMTFFFFLVLSTRYIWVQVLFHLDKTRQRICASIFLGFICDLIDFRYRIRWWCLVSKKFHPEQGITNEQNHFFPTVVQGDRKKCESWGSRWKKK